MTRLIGRLWLAVFRWRFEGEMTADTPKLVFIAAPHTSNWDMPFMLAVAWSLGIRPCFMAKKSLFAPPFGGIMRWLGGVSVDRNAPKGLVGQMAAEFSRRDTLALVVPPEGTRHRTDHWKTGFYRIAQEAQVPIACCFLDFGRRCGGVGPIFVPTGDRNADMARIAEFYTPIKGKIPENFGPVRFADKAEAKPAPDAPA